MSITTRLCAFTAVAAAGVFLWHWSGAPPDPTTLAVQQFQNSDAVAANLQQTSHAHNWWPLLWPALVIALGAVIFWDKIERLWMYEEA